jgi:hypothetical protein
VATEEQNGWVKQTLGIDVGGQAAAASPPIDAGTLWREAKEATDARLGQLASKLRGTGDPDLVRIADFGLFGISGGGKGVNVALNKAMIEYAGSGAEKRPQAAQLLRKAVQQYRATLAANEAVRLVDNNPFGVDVAVAATLGAALEQIESSLP